jgi:cytochrome c oxidase cbb3-type subunit III
MRSRVLFSFLLVASFAACAREERRFKEPPEDTGRSKPASTEAGKASLALGDRYQSNAWAVSEGKRLYDWFNCSGCHANGGGGMGPPLMDAKWIYGSNPDTVFETVMEGRPNGMPGFRGRISDQQAWQLVSYVRSMSGLTRPDVRSSRSEHMSGKGSEALYEKQVPVQQVVP